MKSGLSARFRESPGTAVKATPPGSPARPAGLRLWRFGRLHSRRLRILCSALAFSYGGRQPAGVTDESMIARRYSVLPVSRFATGKPFR